MPTLRETFGTARRRECDARGGRRRIRNCRARRRSGRITCGRHQSSSTAPLSPSYHVFPIYAAIHCTDFDFEPGAHDRRLKHKRRRRIGQVMRQLCTRTSCPPTGNCLSIRAPCKVVETAVRACARVREPEAKWQTCCSR
jgi:hypothetical protein